MRGWGVSVVTIVAALLAILSGGSEPFGRLALRVGLADMAEPLLTDPALKGVALSKQGNHSEAVEQFTKAGPQETYNRATAHALTGDYAEALLSYDDLLARDPDHLDARANFLLLASIYNGTKLELAFADIEREKRDGPTMDAHEAEGGARGVGDGAETDGQANDIFAPELTTKDGLRRVSKVFDDVFIEANEEWLKTMLDQPGSFLAARLRAEQKRRQDAGIAVETEDGAW